MDAPTQSLGDVFIGFSDFCLQMVPEVCWIVSNIQKLGSFRDAESSENFHFFFTPGKKWTPKNPPETIPRVFKPNCGAQVVWK